MTPYTPDNLVDTQLSFISYIITISCGLGLFCILTLGAILTLNSKDENRVETKLAIPIQKTAETKSVVPAIKNPPIQDLTGDDLKAILHKHNLWNIEANAVIPPLVISSFPENLDSLSIDDKKKIFLHALLPIALTANLEIDSERLHLFDILASSGALPGNFKLNDIPDAWRDILSSEDELWLAGLEDKYNATDTKELKKRMRRVPVSLVMAQGALESSWGTSRFAKEGNNLFGLRTWNEPGLTPEQKDAQETYLIASYESILESVQSYLLTLNSHRHYSKFRDIRLSSQDSIVLSKGLIYYSEKRKEYVSQVNRIIKYNSLKKFDTVQLQHKPANTLIVLSKK